MFRLRAILLLALATLVSAQFSGFGGYTGSGGNSNGGSSGSSSFGGGSSGFGGNDDGNGGFSFLSQFANFDLDKAQKIRLAHGVLASAAFVFFFPLGAIAIRIIPTRAAIWIHAFLQLVAYSIYIVGFALGIWLIKNVTFGGFNWLSDGSINYHPIIGIVLFAVLFIQPLLGILHHRLFKRYQRRTIWSYGHIWIGRLGITLGIINGGLGLRLANNAGRGAIIAYGVVAGVIWLVWVLTACLGEIRRARAQRDVPRVSHRHRSDRSYHGDKSVSSDAHHNRRTSRQREQRGGHASYR